MINEHKQEIIDFIESNNLNDIYTNFMNYMIIIYMYILECLLKNKSLVDSC